MRRDFLVGIGLFALVAASAGSAVAADLPVRPPPAAAPVTCCAVPDWAGFYLGIHGGGGWSHTSFDSQFSESGSFEGTPFVDQFTTPPGSSGSGGVFGFQFGHNWQWGPVVGGLEIDFSGANIKQTSTFIFPQFQSPGFSETESLETKIDRLASARGRLGYLIMPNWLLYGTAGIGWAHVRHTATDTQVEPELEFTQFTTSTNHANLFGWVAGVGLEWKFWPGSNSWLLRAEWLHYDFGRIDVFDTACCDNFNARTTVDVARAALSYKF
jgi:opacity protein-like surface antigen